MKRIARPSKLLEVIGFVLAFQTSLAQPLPIRFQHLSIEQGLSNNSVFAITQDKHGLMWIGTSDGLNCFDGYNIEIYRNKPGDKNSLPSNEVLTLFTDSRGIVWIGTGNGLACYDNHLKHFRSFFNDLHNTNSLPGNVITAINEDSNGILWIGTTKGLCSLNVKNNRFQRFLHDNKNSNSMSANGIMDLARGANGTMWISTRNGLNRLDLSSMKFISFFHDPADDSTLSGNTLGKMAIDESGNLWTFLNTSSYVDCFNTKTNRCWHLNSYHEKRVNTFMGFLLCLFIDKTGRLWMGNANTGLSLYMPNKYLFHDYEADPADAKKLQSNTIRAMYQDSSGMIWLATGLGAERFNPQESKFITYHTPLTSLVVGGNSVRAIVEDSSNCLWIGTSANISIFDRVTNTYINDQSAQYHAVGSWLNKKAILSFCCDKEGKVWIGSLDGLGIFDPRHNGLQVFFAVTPQQRLNAPLAGYYIASLFCARNGDILIGTRGGLSIYDSKTHQFINFKHDAAHALLNDQINVVFEDRREIIWLGMRNSGLIKYNRKTGDLKNFTKIASDPNSLPANYVCSIAQDHKGAIWIGTQSGLCRFNETTAKFKIYNEEDGLPNDHVAQLMADDKDRIWMATQKGISVLDESRTKFTNYDPSDGLQGWEFSERSAFRTHDGYFCYGGSNGFNMFVPDSIRNNSFVPPVILRRITIFDQPLDVNGSYADLKRLRLSYKQNFFSFEFAALNYDHPEKNQYACQLVGFDKKIVQLGTNRTVSYTNVPPATYTLKVFASNNDGIWNETAYQLDLTITPPFWATWWFRSMMIIAIIAAIIVSIRAREKRIKKEQARQTAINKQIAEIRMTALRSQMNPHFVFNSLNAIQHFITIRDKDEALNYLSKFSKLIRKILENSRENTVSLSNELQLLELYIQLEQLRFNHKFDYHFEVYGKMDTENIKIPPLLIQPYVENAIIHGLINKDDKGDLWFTVQKNDGTLVCKIEDNGIGRRKAQEIEQAKISKHKSLGIKVTDERISNLSSLLNYKIDVTIEDLGEQGQPLNEMARSSGTRVTISIPISEEE